MTTPNHPWDDQAMADLVGLHPSEPTPDAEQASALPPPASDGEPLLDREDMDQPAVGAGQPKLSLAANPFTKLGVVAAGTGLVIGALAVFTSGVMSGGDAPPEDTLQADFPEPMVEEPEVSATDDRGQLLTDLALGQQQAELEALTREEPPEQESATVQETSTPAPAPPPQPVAARSIPAPPPPRPVPAPSVVAPRPAMAPPMARPHLLLHLGQPRPRSPSKIPRLSLHPWRNALLHPQSHPHPATLTMPRNRPFSRSYR